MSLSNYWVGQKRKDLAERAIVAKRERDAARLQKCIEVDSFHRQMALKSARYRSIEDPQSLKTPRANEESRVKESMKLANKERLESRRRKLAHILAVEHDQYVKELKAMQQSHGEKDPWNIARLKEQIEDLQRKRKETEQHMQKRYMHHLYGSSVSSNERDEQLEKEATEAWEQRKEELEKLSLEKQRQQQEKQQMLEVEKLKATQEARQVEMVKLEEQEQWSKLVQGKMEELKLAECETRKLKSEKQILVQHLETLLSLQRRRDSVPDLQKNTFQKMQNMWHPKEKLRRMLAEVQHCLEFDLKLIQTMMDFNNTVIEDTALALLDLDCVIDVKNKIEMQLALEKQREVEIQYLYNEEASKVLKKFLDQWSMESLTRDEIMTDLFKRFAREINKKVEFSTEQENNFIRMRENRLKEIEDANDTTKGNFQTLHEKQEFYLDRERRLAEELKSLNSNRDKYSQSSDR